MDITRTIRALFFLGSPIAIGGFVIAFIVTAFNRMFNARTFAHIFQEIFKFRPTVAYSNAFTSIVSPSLMVRVMATFAHTVPYLINRSAAIAMCTTTFGCRFCTQASATLCMTAKKVALVYNGILSAYTFTLPSSSQMRRGFHFVQDGKPPECLSIKINTFTIGISHEVYSLLVNIRVRVGREFQALCQPVFIIA